MWTMFSAPIFFNIVFQFLLLMASQRCLDQQSLGVSQQFITGCAQKPSASKSFFANESVYRLRNILIIQVTYKSAEPYCITFARVQGTGFSQKQVKC